MTAEANENQKNTPANKAQEVAAKPKDAVKASTKTPANKPETKAAAVFKQKTSKIGVLAFLLALIAAGGVGALGWLGYQQLEIINQQLATSLNEEKLNLAIQEQTTQNLAKQAALEESLTSLNEEINQQLASQHTNLANLSQEVAAINLPQLNLRQLTEIEFLLERAEVYSQQLNEATTAIQLVELALASTKNLNLSHKNKLLSQLNSDLNQLSQANPSNRLAIARQLYDLAKTTSSLSSFNPANAHQATSSHQKSTTEQPAEALPWYKQAWQEIQGLIVIQQLNEKIEVLPFSPQEEGLKYQINTLLLQAATAANLAEQETYNFCLAAAQKKLKAFLAFSETAENLNKQISQLQTAQLQPKLPSLKASLEELTKLQASINYQGE